MIRDQGSGTGTGDQGLETMESKPRPPTAFRRIRSVRTMIGLMRRTITRTTILPFDPTDALKAAEIGGTLRRKGHPIGADAITAAIAINNGINTIVTRNPKHFQMIAKKFRLTVEPY